MQRAVITFALLCFLAAVPASAADYPAPVQGDYVIRNFTFAAGGSLPALKMHYRTLGQPRRSAAGLLEREITRVPKGRAVVMPASEQTRGHGSHTLAALWKHLLAELLAASGGVPRPL